MEANKRIIEIEERLKSTYSLITIYEDKMDIFPDKAWLYQDKIDKCHAEINTLNAELLIIKGLNT